MILDYSLVILYCFSTIFGGGRGKPPHAQPKSPHSRPGPGTYMCASRLGQWVRWTNDNDAILPLGRPWGSNDPKDGSDNTQTIRGKQDNKRIIRFHVLSQCFGARTPCTRSITNSVLWSPSNQNRRFGGHNTAQIKLHQKSWFAELKKCNPSCGFFPSTIRRAGVLLVAL